MNMYEKKINNIFLKWLICSLFLVFSIIVVGGLTRLTNSGLSITEWELFKGILPPLNSLSWENYFNLYKNIPQFQLVNPNMTLIEFKIIFYWEYFHRILARLIGIFFIIPLIFFYFSKKIKSEYLISCYFIFCLIVLQGIVGWYMVKSGLVNKITVSHYRLSIHLSLAIVIISSLFWIILNKINNTSKKFFIYTKKNIFFHILLLLIFFQIILGAFVSGLDAGKIYQTWPLMGLNYFPDDIQEKMLVEFFNFNNQSLVQFYHRNLAYLITFYILILLYFILKKKIRKLYKPIFLVIFFLFLQITLGVITLVSGLNIYLASSHQITSVLLVFSSIYLYYFNTK